MTNDDKYLPEEQIVDEPVKIAVTFDLDHDLSTVSLSPEESRNKLDWRGLDVGIELIEKSLRCFKDSYNNQIVFSWFVRADNQLESVYGTPSYLLHYLEPQIRQFDSNGDEIAWHPHIYKLHNGTWYLDKSPETQQETLIKTFESIKKNRSFFSVRLGETYCTNTIMNTLHSLGVQVDSSALPGRKRTDDLKTFDWSPTPQEPYRPFVNDYRIPGLPEVGILEVPISMLTIKTNYDKFPLKRYLNLAFHSELIKQDLENYVKHAQYLVTISHPSEFMAENKNDLLSGSIETGAVNLKYILDACEKIGRPYEFVTIKDFIQWY